MLLLIKEKATKKQIEEMAKDLDGFIKVVVDIERNILAGGGEMHTDGEQLLLKDGSNQEDIWGGALDSETKEIDYNSMINLRPNQDNPSRDVMSKEIREKFDRIVKDLLPEAL